MSKISLLKLIWDDWNTEHIKKHSLSREEVEEAIQNINAHRKGNNGRILLIGRSGTRILSIVLGQKMEQKYYVITARDANKKERI